jgi:hypothetical protein
VNSSVQRNQSHARVTEQQIPIRILYWLGIASNAILNASTNFPVSSRPTLNRIKSASTPHFAHCVIISSQPIL